MKELIIDKVSIGKTDLYNAFEIVFGKSTLVKVHGPSVRSSDWKNNKRKVQFNIEVSQIPPVLRSFFFGKELQIDTIQRQSHNNSKIEVINKVKMNFLGSELFVVKPQFQLETIADEVFISGKIKHFAILPPPLNALAERFMVEHSERELQKFSEVLKEQFLAIK